MFQVFHICDTSRKISFLCPNGTIFSQSHLICDWWFKVDCASAPALYESSAEYYSNEQKKSQKITHTLTKNHDLQQIGDTNTRAESRRSSVNVPSTTERLQKHRQRLQTDTPFNIGTPRSFQSYNDFAPTQRTQATTALEKRRRNLVQLISNNFAAVKTTPMYSQTTKATPIDYNLKEMQIVAESASFANNNNRQFLQDYHTKNYRPYPVYTPNIPKPKSKPNPNLTTLYDIRDKHIAQESQEVTKRPSLVSYTKSYTTYDNHQPYTRPGVSLLKGYIEKEKNKTLSATTTTTTTEKIPEVTHRSDKYENDINTVIIQAKNTFESATKIPQTTKVHITETVSPDRSDVYFTTNQVNEATTEPTYKVRRDRLMRKLNLGDFGLTDSYEPITTESILKEQFNKSGLAVSPSLSPKALHSLAIYYATAVDNLSTTTRPDDDETTTQSIDYEAMEEALPALFSQHTIHKYSDLFHHDMEQTEFLEEMRTELNGTFGELSEDLTVQQSQNPIATSPQIRELAQVFTHALSAYLQDPVQFRKVLSDIRPTHPSFGELLFTTEESINTEIPTTTSEDDDEILGFSEDNKLGSHIQSIRGAKALSVATSYSPNEETTTLKPDTASRIHYGNHLDNTARNPFRCCGRISASYTKSTTPFIASTTPTYPNTVAVNINNLSTISDHRQTTSGYVLHKYGGFQNNALTQINAYGNEQNITDSQPLKEYIEATNLPTAWGIDASSPTVSTTHTPGFESKKLSTTTIVPTTTPNYFTKTERIELENEEELQRAHSESFVAPQNTRHGKQLKINENPAQIKTPSEDLEAPSLSDSGTTIVQTSTPLPTVVDSEDPVITTTPGSVFTSSDSEKTTYQQWASTLDGWQTTIIDPITLNDGLSHTGTENTQTVQEENTFIPSTTITQTEYTGTTEPSVSSTINVEIITNVRDERIGRLLRDSSTESAQDLSTITDTVVEKAKEIMGGMNATTTEKLMNVMKKTKSKTVKRLILLLIQTCDDDHNSTAEASKKALLEALMAVSQKDMEEMAKEEVTETPTTASDYDIRTTIRRMDRQEMKPRQFERRGKSLNFEPSVINSLSNPTTEVIKDRDDLETVSSTNNPRTTTSSRRGLKKYRTTPEIRTTKVPTFETPVAEARTSVQESDLKTASDTRALELLRSLYTIAARWG